MIKRPKGTVGCSGFSLITEMKLDKKNPKDRILYYDILVSSVLEFGEYKLLTIHI